MANPSARTGVMRAKLFKNGSSQAVRLPAGFRFEGEEVYIWRDERAGTVVLSPRKRITWDDFNEARAKVPQTELDDFMTERHQPPHQVRASLDIED